MNWRSQGRTAKPARNSAKRLARTSRRLRPHFPFERRGALEGVIASFGVPLRTENGQGLFLPFPGTNSPPKRNGVRGRGLLLFAGVQAHTERRSAAGNKRSKSSHEERPSRSLRAPPGQWRPWKE